jgi:hypothetical protein
VGTARLPDLGGAAPVDDALVVLVVPSLAVLMQAAWLEDIRAQGQRSFADWWASASGSEGTGWRYDVVLASWARVAGPERVHVIVGEDRATASGLLDALVGGATLAADPWLRSLRVPEVRLVEELVTELLGLGLVGRNAADLAHGGADALRRAPAQEPPSAAPPDDGLTEPVGRVAAAMEARVDALGVSVHGDRSALGWPTAGGVSDSAAVPLPDSLTLPVGMLERVTEWGSGEEVAR